MLLAIRCSASRQPWKIQTSGTWGVDLRLSAWLFWSATGFLLQLPCSVIPACKASVLTNEASHDGSICVGITSVPQHREERIWKAAAGRQVGKGKRETPAHKPDLMRHGQPNGAGAASPRVTQRDCFIKPDYDLHSRTNSSYNLGIPRTGPRPAM